MPVQAAALAGWTGFVAQAHILPSLRMDYHHSAPSLPFGATIHK